MRRLILLAALLTGCEGPPVTTQADVKIWKQRDGKTWRVTFEATLEASSRADAAERAATVLSAMSKASEAPPVPAEKMEDVPKSGEGKTGV